MLKFYRPVNGVGLVHHDSEKLTQEGELALYLVKCYGLVAAKPVDETDIAGNQKHQLMTPEEVVTKACTIARITFDNLRAMGWCLDVPNPVGFEEIEQ